jgi:hypothetical protein
MDLNSNGWMGRANGVLAERYEAVDVKTHIADVLAAVELAGQKRA